MKDILRNKSLAIIIYSLIGRYYFGLPKRGPFSLLELTSSKFSIEIQNRSKNSYNIKKGQRRNY